MFLPQITALTIELKLSSIKIMDDASRATSVPDIPIAKPTSAFFKAGASLVPKKTYFSFSNNEFSNHLL